MYKIQEFVSKVNHNMHIIIRIYHNTNLHEAVNADKALSKDSYKVKALILSTLLENRNTINN